MSESNMEDVNGREENLEFPQDKPRLTSIDDSDHHRLLLREFRREVKFLESDYDRKLSTFGRAKFDLFTVLGLNLGFQGLLVSAIAPSQIVVCRHWPFVCALSVIASVGTFVAAMYKLDHIAQIEQRVQIQRKQLKWQMARIDELKTLGTEFDMRAMRNFNVGITDMVGHGVLEKWKASVMLFWENWLWSGSGAILALLLAFSVAIPVSSLSMLCG